MKVIAIASLTLAAAASLAHGSVIVQWNYNSLSPDGNVGTGTQSAAIGTGFTGTVLTSSSFGAGSANDPASGDNSGFSLTGFASPNSGNNSRGAQFTSSTAGYWNIGFNWEQMSAANASRYAQVQYTVNGTTWQNIGVVDVLASNGAFAPFSATGIGNGAGNNPSFAVRLMASFGSGGSNYTALSGTYASTGMWRFDMATITGTANTAPTGGMYSGGPLLPGDAAVTIDLATLWSDADTAYGDVVSLTSSLGSTEFSLSGTLLTFTPPSSVVGAGQTYSFNFGVTDKVGATGDGRVEFTVTPTPGSAVLFACGLAAAARRRRV